MIFSLRRSVVVTLIGLAMFFWASAFATPQAIAVGSQAPVIPALDTISRCVRDKQQLLVLLVIDESGSLKQTDPANQRVTAAKTALESLAGLAEHEINGHRPSVKVAVSGFSVDYETIVPWTNLDYSNVESAKTAVQGLASKNNGIDTDYAAALIGAQSALAEQIKQTAESPPCSTILWFTDGKYDIERNASRPNPTKAYAPQIRLDRADGPAKLVEAGQIALCRPGGLVDELRTAGTGNIALGLTAQLKPEDQAFLAALTTGHAGTSASCGSVDGLSTGAFIPVNDLSQLIASLDSVGATLGYGVQGKVEAQIPVCASNACAEGERPFPVDLGMSRIHLTAQTGGTDINVVLRSPSGTETFVPAAAPAQTGRQVGSAQVRAVWLAPDVVSLDVSLPPEDERWAGIWTLSMVRPTGAASALAPGFRVFYFGTTSVKATRGGSTTAGRTSFSLQLLTAPKGIPLSKTLLADATFDVQAMALSPKVSASGTMGAAASSAVRALIGARRYDLFSAELSTDPAVDPNPTVDVSVRVTTKSGIVLAPTVIRLDLPTVASVSTTSSVPSSARGVAVKSKDRGSNTPLFIVAGLGLGTLLAGGFLLQRRRKTLSGLGDVRISVRQARVAFDLLGRSRIVWVSPEGAETQFRLDRASFVKTLQQGRVREFSIGELRVTKDPGSKTAIFESASSLLITGPGTAELPAQWAFNQVRSDATIAPMWLFVGRYNPASAEAREPDDRSGPKSSSQPRSGGETILIGRENQRSSASAPNRPQTPEQMLEGNLFVAVRSDNDVSLLERDIAEQLPSLVRIALRNRPR